MNFFSGNYELILKNEKEKLCEIFSVVGRRNVMGDMDILPTHHMQSEAHLITQVHHGAHSHANKNKI